MQNVTILGSTGSIGQQTLDVIEDYPNLFQVYALTAHRNVERLAQQCVHYRPQYAVITDVDRVDDLSELLRANKCSTKILAGPEGLEEVATASAVTTVMAAIVGAAGLLPTLAAVRAGKRILLANKEALIMAGDVFIDAVREHQVQVLPVDSEHNAIFQCMPNDFVPCHAPAEGVDGIILTASGGPFLNTSLDDLLDITPEQAVAHPNWNMGAKISVDSATMMNKGLEVIEARALFQLPESHIEVLCHPQSVIHSLVRYHDGSVLAQLGTPDMRTPIANTLAWPHRIHVDVERLDLLALSRLDFVPMDEQRFPCFALALEALKAQNGSVTVLNAANEVAVKAFLEKRIRFLQIAEVIQATLERTETSRCHDLEQVLMLDQLARARAEEQISARVPGIAEV